VITFAPDVGLVTFENRARTGPADSSSTIEDNFFRKPGTWDLWAEARHAGTSAVGGIGRAARSQPLCRAALERSLNAGGSRRGRRGEHDDSLAYRRSGSRHRSPSSAQALGDILFPILNTSQNWFAEMLLKILGREFRGAGSWEAGLDVERRFLVDSVRLDSTAFALETARSRRGKLITPHAVVQILAYMYRHPKRAPFVLALPRSGRPGSLLKRFVGTPLEGAWRPRRARSTGSTPSPGTSSDRMGERSSSAYSQRARRGARGDAGPARFGGGRDWQDEVRPGVSLGLPEEGHVLE